MGIRFIALLCLTSFLLFGCASKKEEVNFFTGGYVEQEEVTSSELPPSPKPVKKAEPVLEQPAPAVEQPAPAVEQPQSFLMREQKYSA